MFSKAARRIRISGGGAGVERPYTRGCVVVTEVADDDLDWLGQKVILKEFRRSCRQSAHSVGLLGHLQNQGFPTI